MKRAARIIAYLAFATFSASAAVTSFTVDGAEAAPWMKILGSVGIVEGGKMASSITITSQADAATLADDQIVIVQGNTPAAKALGFSPKAESVAVRQICDVHAPKMQIIWEQPLSIPAEQLPPGFQIFASEKWKGAPVLAGKRTKHGAILWMATDPGPTGGDRYPYLLQALVDLGLSLPVRSTTLWAFFDSAYRIRADPDYLAQKWRAAGIDELHVAAWHNMEPDAAQDEYLKKLIEACHRNAILVYAWLELPHVSEKFWADHAAWREKTALGQDAQLDWRKLMNLQNPDCKREVAKEIGFLLQRFDWDGVNVAELYFESLEGASNPARFTPMNDEVRAEFKEIAGWDPKLLFDPSSTYNASKNPQALRKFLDFRAVLASRMQSDWLDVIGKSKVSKPYLDVVLTHIDDQLQPGIRDELGADIARSLPKIQARHCALLVEDPATLWDLGPERYAKLAKKYAHLTPDRDQLAIDINVVERYQDVYPTKKQTGVELLELVHQAADSFGQVALYFENSLEKQDLPLLAAAATTATVTREKPDELQVNAPKPIRILWQGLAQIDGKLWPVQNAETVLVPAGRHTLLPAVGLLPVTVTDFNGDIRSATAVNNRVDVAYRSRSRAIAVLSARASSIEVDGVSYQRPEIGNEMTLILPAGQHVVTLHP